MMRRLKQWIRGAGASPDARADAPELRVLMVCMGNICRSPTAEGVLRAMLQRSALKGRVQVDSAGTHGYHTDEAPDARAIRHAALRGYDLSRMRARPVQSEDFNRFHLLLAMDEDNQAWLLRRAPAGACGQVELLMDYAPDHAKTRAVPDPYYGGPAGFEHVLDLVEAACGGLVDRLLTRSAGGGPLA
jgi:protein-tyrosine phosphatase